MTTVTGSGALFGQAQDLSPVADDLLEQAFGAGDFRLSGDVWADDTELPQSGTCRYVLDNVMVLEVSIGSRGLPFSPYDGARSRQAEDPRAVAIADDDGYVMSEEVVDLDGSVAERAVAVVFRGDSVIIANIRVPRPGVDYVPLAVAMAQQAAERFARPLAAAR